MVDPAFAAVAAYWEAMDALEANRRGGKEYFRELGRAQRTGSRRAVERAADLIDANGREWGATLRDLRRVRETLANVTPATRRGAIEMLTAALADFSPPFEDGAGSRVFGPAEALDVIRRVRDALELWETQEPPLREDEPK